MLVAPGGAAGLIRTLKAQRSRLRAKG
jgi:hypothetical protein